MVIAGPFNAVIPIPGDAQIGEPEHTTEKFLSETLKVSKAGYFADDQFVMVQVETTNAPAGTLTNENLPIYKIGDRDFRARTLCMDISREGVTRSRLSSGHYGDYIGNGVRNRHSAHIGVWCNYLPLKV